MTKSKLAKVESLNHSGLYARLTWFVVSLDAAIVEKRHLSIDGIAAGLRALDTYRGHDASEKAVAEMFRVSDMGRPPLYVDPDRECPASGLQCRDPACKGRDVLFCYGKR